MIGLRVAVQLGQHDAGDVQRLVKGAGGVYRVLAGHGVDDEHDLGRLGGGLDVLQLVHELLVYVKAAGRVQKDEVVAVLLSMGNTGLGNLDRVALAELENRYLQLRADGF